MKRFFFYSAAAAALSLTLVAGGCSRKVYVPVENVRVVRDTVVDRVWARDTLLLRDSTVTWVRGDTVRIERWHDSARASVVRDTVVRLLHDSLSNPGKAAAEVAAAMERKGEAMRKELEQRQEKEKRHSVVSAVAVLIFLIFGAVAFSLGRRRG